MAAIHESTRNSVTLRLLDHAEAHWPQLTRVTVAYRGAFGCVTGVLRGGKHIQLCHLRYGGSAHSFVFAIYSTAHDRYQDAVLRAGLPPAPARSPRHRLHYPPPCRTRPRARLLTPTPSPDELTGPPTTAVPSQEPPRGSSVAGGRRGLLVSLSARKRRSRRCACVHLAW